MLQAFDGFPLLFLDVDKLLIEDAEDPVEPAIDFFDLVRMPASFLNDPSYTGIDDGSGPA